MLDRFRGPIRIAPRALLAVVGLAIAALTLSACLPSTPAENGRLPDSALTTIGPTCRVANDVAPRLVSLLVDANRAGYAIQPESQSNSIVPPPSIESCYRSYDGQVWWRNYYCFFATCDLAAVPGTSVHGWGRAVDFECAGKEMTFTDPCYLWLWWNARNYGFVHPAWAEPGQSSSEAWHWEAT
jgi:hypothetical protein